MKLDYDPRLDIFVNCQCGWGGCPLECSTVETADSSGDYPAVSTICCPECLSVLVITIHNSLKRTGWKENE